mmetsp:Transcript_6940/g.15160  ORF Transcript_6940/g.15160 Transcript_6940/m.15160 type:complete len:141 (-) Transcript_6940:385-807(-)
MDRCKPVGSEEKAPELQLPKENDHWGTWQLCRGALERKGLEPKSESPSAAAAAAAPPFVFAAKAKSLAASGDSSDMPKGFSLIVGMQIRRWEASDLLIAEELAGGCAPLVPARPAWACERAWFMDTVPSLTCKVKCSNVS